jgi:CheY-like chemotaxis protein
MSYVLTVDDEPGNNRLLVTFLRLLGYEAKSANTGALALEFLHTHPCNLLILDWMMPVMGGLEVLRTVRQEHQFDDLPVVMFTACSDADSRSQAFAAGAQEYVVKGNIPELQQAIEYFAGALLPR